MKRETLIEIQADSQEQAFSALKEQHLAQILKPEDQNKTLRIKLLCVESKVENINNQLTQMTYVYEIAVF